MMRYILFIGRNRNGVSSNLKLGFTYISQAIKSNTSKSSRRSFESRASTVVGVPLVGLSQRRNSRDSSASFFALSISNCSLLMESGDIDANLIPKLEPWVVLLQGLHLNWNKQHSEIQFSMGIYP